MTLAIDLTFFSRSRDLLTQMVADTLEMCTLFTESTQHIVRVVQTKDGESATECATAASIASDSLHYTIRLTRRS